MGKIFLPDWIRILNALPADSVHSITKIDVTFSHVWNVIKEMEKKGLVKTELKGRQRHIELTKNGERLQVVTAKLEGYFISNLKIMGGY